jgi:transcriptional regulator with XRE-family HTH domain
MSMRAMAAATRISAPYVNELEKGRSRPGLDVVVRICAVVELPITECAELLGYDLGQLSIDFRRRPNAEQASPHDR